MASLTAGSVCPAVALAPIRIPRTWIQQATLLRVGWIALVLRPNSTMEILAIHWSSRLSSRSDLSHSCSDAGRASLLSTEQRCAHRNVDVPLPRICILSCTFCCQVGSETLENRDNDLFDSDGSGPNLYRIQGPSNRPSERFSMASSPLVRRSPPY